MTDRDAYIALNLAEGVGPITVGRLVGFAGSAAAVFGCSASDLRRVQRVGEKLAAGVLSVTPEDVAAELALAAEAGAEVVTPADSGYPEPLRDLPTPPSALYIRGQWRPCDARGAAVVGTRRPTQYGLNITRKLGFALGRAGVTVVSGLARGIDTVAHQGALSAGGRTVGVLGCGLCHMYPSENSELANEMVEHGAVISELPMRRKPDKTTFPMRNRIVSGLTRGVVVIEAGRRSGAIITAEAAMEQGRSVYALPGRIDSFASQGTNRLLRDGAHVVTAIEDVVEAFGILLGPQVGLAAVVREPVGSLGADEQAVLACVGHEPMDVDELIRASELSAARINTLLVTMELKRLIRMQPGRRIERI
jgi:DNA processing protein